MAPHLPIFFEFLRVEKGPLSPQFTAMSSPLHEDSVQQHFPLTADERERALEIFMELDPCREGISPCDLARLSRCLGEPFAVTSMEEFELLCSCELNENSKVTFEEFVRLMEDRKRKAQPIDRKEILLAYASCGGDPSGEGFINTEALIKLVKEDFGLAINIGSMIDEIDEDRSGKIEFGECVVKQGRKAFAGTGPPYTPTPPLTPSPPLPPPPPTHKPHLNPHLSSPDEFERLLSTGLEMGLDRKRPPPKTPALRAFIKKEDLLGVEGASIGGGSSGEALCHL